MKILGIDFGTKKIGLAVAEEGLVEPYGELKVQGSRFKVQNLRERISQICQIEEIEKIVVGVSEGKSGERAKEFGQRLAEITGLPVEFSDETLTTRDALVKMKTVSKKWRGKLDAVAAALILESYLNV